MRTKPGQWWTRSWNIVTGCSPVSAGCANCYAAAMVKRYPAIHGAGVPFSQITFHPERLEQLLHWKKPQRIFVCDCGDLFHVDASAEWREQIFDVMAQCPQHKFILLTKRAVPCDQSICDKFLLDFPHNLWVGTTAENSDAWLERVEFWGESEPNWPFAGAPLHWISLEPLIEFPLDNSAGFPASLRWVVIGGESGPQARPVELGWIHELIRFFRAWAIPVYVKQLGTWQARRLGLKDYKGADMDEWPEELADLKVREMPEGLRLPEEERT